MDGDVVLLPVGAHFAYGGGFAVFGGRLHGNLRKLAADAVAVKQGKSGAVAYFGKGMCHAIGTWHAVFQWTLFMALLLADFVNRVGEFGRGGFLFIMVVEKSIQRFGGLLAQFIGCRFFFGLFFG